MNKSIMIITINKVNRVLREGISKKTGKPYSFESLGIAPNEDKLTDINGDEFDRAGRWINGISKKGTTEQWGEGDKIKILLLRKNVMTKEGEKEVINFSLPEGTDSMVEKAGKTAPVAEETDNVDPTW
jgi:hypothetical protein